MTTEQVAGLDPEIRMDLERYLKILKVELEHLCEHIDLMVDTYQNKQRTHELTEHVCNENVAVLQNEECACARFIQILGELHPGAFENLDQLIAEIRSRFTRVLERSGLAQAAYAFAERKILKVERYVRE